MKRQQSSRETRPLAAYALGFQKHLEGLGYSPDSADFRLRQLATLDRWLHEHGLDATDLDQTCIDRLVAARRAAHRKTLIATANFTVPLEYLRGIGVVPQESPPTDPLSLVFEQYRQYLSTERGLVHSSIVSYLEVAKIFCSHLVLPLKELTPDVVMAYIAGVSERYSVSWAKKNVTALASFFRFLHVTGITSQPLATVLPKISGHRPPPPGPLSEDDVQRMLDGCDQTSDVGLRDHTILVVLLRLGLRRGEVANLRVDDINWRRAEITIHGKGNRYELLPMPTDVGDALVDYLHHGHRRVPQGCRAIFVNVRAPEAGMTPAGISDVVTRAAQRVGLPTVGAHRLRRGTATQLVSGGASWSEVAQVLRHRSMAVTVSYATVDIELTRQLARPWPGAS